jgi:hypothetical protein
MLWHVFPCPHFRQKIMIHRPIDTAFLLAAFEQTKGGREADAEAARHQALLRAFAGAAVLEPGLVDEAVIKKFTALATSDNNGATRYAALEALTASNIAERFPKGTKASLRAIVLALFKALPSEEPPYGPRFFSEYKEKAKETIESFVTANQNIGADVFPIIEDQLATHTDKRAALLLGLEIAEIMVARKGHVTPAPALRLAVTGLAQPEDRILFKHTLALFAAIARFNPRLVQPQHVATLIDNVIGLCAGDILLHDSAAKNLMIIAKHCRVDLRPDLKQAMLSPNPVCREQAQICYGHLVRAYPDDTAKTVPEAFTAAAEGTKDAAYAVREAAQKNLRCVLAADPNQTHRAIALIKAAVSDKTTGVRMAGYETCKAMSYASNTVADAMLPVILNGLTDEQDYVRFVAEEARTAFIAARPDRTSRAFPSGATAPMMIALLERIRVAAIKGHTPVL